MPSPAVCVCVCGWTPRLRYQSGCPNSLSPSSTFTASAINGQIRLECKRSNNQSICVCVCVRKQFNHSSQWQVRESNWCLRSPHSVRGNINHNDAAVIVDILTFVKKRGANCFWTYTQTGSKPRRPWQQLTDGLFPCNKSFRCQFSFWATDWRTSFIRSDFTCKISTMLPHFYRQVFAPNRKWKLVRPAH